MTHDFTLLTFDILDSTHDEARRIAPANRGKNIAVMAKTQTAGRGRYGRAWLSPPGNLYLSLVVWDNCPLRILAELSFVAALAAGESLLPYLPNPEDLAYKWPNDILLGNRKTAGILLESLVSEDNKKAEGVLVGIGVNLVHTPPVPDKPATSLKDNGCILPENAVEEIGRKFLEAFNQCYRQWATYGFCTIREQWLQRAWNLGKPITVDFGNRKLEGIFHGMTPTGELVLEQAGGAVEIISSGEVFF